MCILQPSDSGLYIDVDDVFDLFSQILTIVLRKLKIRSNVALERICNMQQWVPFYHLVYLIILPGHAVYRLMEICPRWFSALYFNSRFLISLIGRVPNS